ncbi:MAG: hypothetical protein QNJ68_17030 [Microcoleaceae cyanobacterium MO_207.B10]|nr:hypothetical protein [Microcoleaceae cyanobacterium MO_207.B10]
MAPNNLRELAKQGDPKVISSIINHSLQKKGINVQVGRDNGYLEITLESDQVSHQKPALVEFIRTGIAKLGVESIHTIKVYGVETGDQTPVWEEEIRLRTPPTNPIPEIEDISEERFPDPLDKLDEEVEEDYETETDEDYEEDDEDYALDYDQEDNYEEEDEDEEEFSETPQGQKKKTPLILAILLLIILVPVAVFAALHFSGIFPLFGGSKSETTTEKVDTAESPASKPSNSENQTSTSPKASSPDPWYNAVSSAQSAAQKAQTAQTNAEWNAVADDWQKAFEFMKEVPQSDPNYQKAQDRIPVYENNLSVAKQKAAQAPN